MASKGFLNDSQTLTRNLISLVILWKWWSPVTSPCELVHHLLPPPLIPLISSMWRLSEHLSVQIFLKQVILHFRVISPCLCGKTNGKIVITSGMRKNFRDIQNKCNGICIFHHFHTNKARKNKERSDVSFQLLLLCLQLLQFVLDFKYWLSMH